MAIKTLTINEPLRARNGAVVNIDDGETMLRDWLILCVDNAPIEKESPGQVRKRIKLANKLEEADETITLESGEVALLEVCVSLGAKQPYNTFIMMALDGAEVETH